MEMMEMIIKDNNCYEYVNNEICVSALKRSGHHAIINWIIKQSNGEYFYSNDIEPSQDPVNRPKKWLDIGPKFETKKQFFIYSFEDREFKDIFDYNNVKKRKNTRQNKSFYNIIVLRDPFNYFASRLQASRKKGVNWAWRGPENIERATYYMNLWKSYAKEFLNITTIINNKLCINYNKWVKDKEYRKSLANQLGLVFTDKGVNEVVKHGGGSSFDRKFNGKASEMDVLNRWKHFTNDNYYISLFDKEILSLSKQIWEENTFFQESFENVFNKNRKSILVDFRCLDKYYKDRCDTRSEILFNVIYKMQTSLNYNIILWKGSGTKRKLRKKIEDNKELIYDCYENDEGYKKAIDNIDLYISFDGRRSVNRRKLCKKKNIPCLLYEAGPLRDSLIIDKKSTYSGFFTNSISIEKYPIHNDITNYCNNIINSGLSKRTQPTNDLLLPNNNYILLLGQALYDTTICKWSDIGLLDFIEQVVKFAKENFMTVVFKPHPHLNPNQKRHGEKRQIEHCKKLQKKYGNLEIIQGSIYKLMTNALFVATLNTNAIVDCFINNTPSFCCGRNYFRKTGAVIYNKNIESALEIMLFKQYDSELMIDKQKRVISWLRDNLLFLDMDPLENIKRIKSIVSMKEI